MDNSPARAVNPRRRAWRLRVLAGYVLGTLVIAMALPTIPQDLAYHDFADRRGWLGIPNFGDVVSNLPFALAGLWGVRLAHQACAGPARVPWMVLFAGIALVAIGSAWYHWQPSNSSLVWDRLPMTVGFMGLVVALFAEYLGWKRTLPMLAAAIALGIASVAWWAISDDLRLYAWVQFMPLGAILLLLALWPPGHTHVRLLGAALGFYLLAKVLEHYDERVFRLTGELVSGHTLKHLSAAGGCLALAAYILQRRTFNAPGAH